MMKLLCWDDLFELCSARIGSQGEGEEEGVVEGVCLDFSFYEYNRINDGKSTYHHSYNGIQLEIIAPLTLGIYFWDYKEDVEREKIFTFYTSPECVRFLNKQLLNTIPADSLDLLD